MNKSKIRNLIFYGILLLSIPFSAMAIEVFIDGLRYSVDENQEEDMMGGRTSNFWKTYGGKYQTITDKVVNITGDLEFQDEIKPDGATCAVGQILKKTGTDNWDCAADDNSGGTADLSTAQLGQIGDVSTSSPMTYGELLIYNTATPGWESVATSTLGLGGSAGTVSSVAMSVPTGLTITGSPITTSGTLALTLTGGYQMLTDVASTTWDGKWDALSDMALAHQSIYLGNASNNPEATSTITILDSSFVGIGTTSPAYKLDVYGNMRADGDIRTTGTFYGDTWSSITGNSMNIKPSGDEDDFLSFKTVANRATIKVEGDSKIYVQSSDNDEVGIEYYKDASHSGGVIYYKNEELFGLTSQDSMVFKVCGDYDDYVKICSANNIPELSVASSSAFKINAGGTNSLLLNHDGGNVGIGTSSPAYELDVYGSVRIENNLITTNASTTLFSNSGDSWLNTIKSGTWNGTALTDAYVSNTLTVDGYMQDGDINTFSELQSWVSDEVLLKSGTLTDTKYCIYDSASGDIICNSEGGGSSFSSIATLNALMTGESVASTTNIWADAYISSATTWNAKWDALTDMVLTDNYIYVGDASNDPVGVAMSNDCTIASDGSITCDHDALDNFVANEHLDWTGDLGAVNIHAGNYTNTTYTGGTNLTLTDTTFNVDDVFITNTNYYATTTHEYIATLSALTSIGTIATGVWEATDIGVSYGGTGLSDPTDHAVLVGSGASAMTALTVATNGQILIGSTGADPVFANLICGDNISCTTGAGTLEIDVDDAFFSNTGDIVIGSSTIVGDWTVNGNATTTGDMVVGTDGGVKPACFVGRDVDSGGYSYGYLLNGAITWSTVDCTGAATSTIIIGR